MIKHYKYALDFEVRQTLSLPKGAVILKAGMDKDKKLSIWVDVSQEESDVREFYVYGTGHLAEKADKQIFIDTVIDGDFVWHVYEKGYHGT